MHFSVYLPYLRHIVTKRTETPLYFLHSVTERCTAHCAHCFVPLERRGYSELQLDEIEKMSRTMGRFIFLFLTGGEAFLRDDLPEIARIYYTNNGMRKMQIPSNGSLGQQNIRILRRLLKACPEAHVGCGISLDAVGELHDRIRGYPGLFERATATFREYKRLARECPNMGCQINVTVSAFNQDHLPELFHYLTTELKLDNIIYVLCRGNPQDPAAKKLNPDKVEAWNNLVDEELRGHRLVYSGYPWSEAMNIKNLITHRINIDMLRDGRYRMPCYAGRLAASMASNGDVYPCELWPEPIGNVRESGYDFRKIWLSPNAEEIRRTIRRTRCHCTHECFASTNVFFNPRFLPRIGWEWLGFRYQAAKNRFGRDRP